MLKERASNCIILFLLSCKVGQIFCWTHSIWMVWLRCIGSVYWNNNGEMTLLNFPFLIVPEGPSGVNWKRRKMKNLRYFLLTLFDSISTPEIPRCIFLTQCVIIEYNSSFYRMEFWLLWSYVIFEHEFSKNNQWHRFLYWIFCHKWW